MGKTEERGALHQLAKFPRVAGYVQSVIPFGRCHICAPSEPVERAGTHVAYDGDPVCLRHAKWLKKNADAREGTIRVLERMREEQT